MEIQGSRLFSHCWDSKIVKDTIRLTDPDNPGVWLDITLDEDDLLSLLKEMLDKEMRQ